MTLDPDPLHVPDDPESGRPVLRPARPWGCVLAVVVSLAAWAVGLWAVLR